MIFLILSILSSSCIFVVFKLYERFGINTLHAIIFNYFFAFSAGILVDKRPEKLLELPLFDWFPGALLLGCMFIAIFYLAGLTTQKSGLSVVSVATKMSVVIPIFFGIFLYSESTGTFKIIGIVVALIAVYLTSLRNKEGLALERKQLLLPIGVFLGSGIIDTTIKYLESSFVDQRDVALFTASIFAVAGIIGSCILIIKKASGNLRMSFNDVLGGIALGIPNFGSIYFLVLALRQPGVESSTIFPLNNVAIVMLSTLLGIVLFKERISWKNWIGIVLSILSITLIYQA